MSAVVRTPLMLRLRAFDSAYPGSMFDKEHGSYVERDDVESLAAALVENVRKRDRELDDLKDGQREIEDQRDELLATLKELHRVCAAMDLEHEANRPSEAEYIDAMEAAQAAIAKATGSAA